MNVCERRGITVEYTKLRGFVGRYAPKCDKGLPAGKVLPTWIGAAVGFATAFVWLALPGVLQALEFPDASALLSAGAWWVIVLLVIAAFVYLLLDRLKLHSRPAEIDTKEESDDGLGWLSHEFQARCRQLAQSSLPVEDEQAALKLSALYKAYDKVCNLKNDEEKAECHRVVAEAAELGRKLCENGGAKRMLLVAFRAEKYGARVRSIELFWDGICGWQW